MNELLKTAIFVLLGAVCLTLALREPLKSLPSETTTALPAALFPNFQDPYAAKQMEVISYDSALDRMDAFEVAQVNGQWVIPSRSNYPADAEERLKKAATLLIDLPPIAAVGDRREDHQLYQVVEPDKNTTEVGEKGVGKLVSFRGEKNERLAALIIGRQVKDSDSQYYVRIPGQDMVYTAKIDPSQISTRFQDWIKRDLLSVAGYDISEFEVRDYSVDLARTSEGPRLVLSPRFEIDVRWDTPNYQWELKELREYQNRQYHPRTLRDDEELDKTNLDAMKNAIRDLKIVDVRRKPAGLRPSGQSEKPIWEDMEALTSLEKHGFYAQPSDDKKGIKVYCSDGEVDIRTKNGVMYTLWFGAQSATVDDAGDSRIDRYMMISAAVDPQAFQKPELQLPPEPTTTPVPQRPAQEEATQEADAAQEADAPEPTSTLQAETSEPEETHETPTTGDAPKVDPERDRLIKEYQRKLDTYNEQVKKAETEARELNARLGDWYFVVADDVYNKIRLRKSQIIKSKAPAKPEMGNGVEAFRMLQEQGLDKEEEEAQAEE